MLYDLIIVGGGPAGITAGIYAGRQRMRTLLITKDFGGQVAKKATEICNYPGFPRISAIDLIDKFVSQLKEQETVEIKISEVGKVIKEGEVFTVKTTNEEEFKAKCVIVATGADPRPLEVPGEKEFIGRGVSYCVTCDGPLFKNKEIAIIGGGNSGLEAALFMRAYAKKIYIFESSDTLKADETNIKEVLSSPQIEVFTNVIVKEIKGDKMVSEIFYTKKNSQEIKSLKIDGVFIEIGTQPATSLVKDLVDFNERDEIIVEQETLATKTPGLFAAGDNNIGQFKQIVTAAGEGCKAALAAYQYLKRISLSHNE